MNVLVAYDVTDDSRRARLAALLQVWGDRVQKSVFVLGLSASDLDELRRRAVELVNTNTDSVYIIPLCQNCWDGHRTLGQAHLEPKTIVWTVL